MARTKTTSKAATAPKAEAKVEEVVKTEDTAVIDTTEKKTAAKKTACKTAEKKNELFIQFSGFEFSYDELLEKVKADYAAQTGKKTVTSTKLYVKPEDMKVYYVVNEKFMGDVYLG